MLRPDHTSPALDTVQRGFRGCWPSAGGLVPAPARTLHGYVAALAPLRRNALAALSTFLFGSGAWPLLERRCVPVQSMERRQAHGGAAARIAARCQTLRLGRP